MMNSGEVKNFVAHIHKTLKELHDEKNKNPQQLLLDDYDLGLMNEVVRWAAEIVHNEVELR